jgi:hypothetical protein
MTTPDEEVSTGMHAVALIRELTKVVEGIASLDSASLADLTHCLELAVVRLQVVRATRKRRYESRR